MLEQTNWQNIKNFKEPIFVAGPYIRYIPRAFSKYPQYTETAVIKFFFLQ